MSALIEGYNYDIFISYRQNDNKYDGWVTEFVNNLRKELEATIKEKLTIYFDENPVDGLLESHSVEQTLNSKLKCLIFIPVISQTYCDTNSYAWQYEFRIFNRLVREDRFGMNTRLSNGNIASRILAVRIHELDDEDRKTIEKETGEKLRSIDFIYRSAGVNRPLRANEDHSVGNLYKYYYRDQINKVANSVKDIISGLRRKDQVPDETTTDLVISIAENLPSQLMKIRRRVLWGTLTILILAVFLFLYSGNRREASMEKSIAVLPFRNDSPGDSNTYFINGVMEEILNNLQVIKDVRIISRTSVERYRNTEQTVPQIAKELGVNYIVEGSGQRHGSSFRVHVKLIRAKKENYLWSKLYEQRIGNPADIVNVQSEIAQSIVTELDGSITPTEKELIEKIPTTNLTAYDFYQKGKDELSKFWIDITNTSALEKAEKLFNKALEADPAFAYAIIGQAEVLWHKHTYMGKENLVDSVFMLTDIALSYDDKIPDAYVIKGWCFDDAGMAYKAHGEYKKAIDLNPNDWKAYFGLAELYDFEDPVRSLTNLKKAVSLTHGLVELPTLLRHIGGELLVTGYIGKAAEYFSKAFELDDDSAIYLSCLGGIEQIQGNYDNAIEIYKKAFLIKDNYNEVVHNLAVYSQLSGKDSESLEYYRQLESRNAMSFNMHRMGYSLCKNGFEIEGYEYFRKHIEYCDEILQTRRRSDLVIYTYYDLAGIYAFLGDREQSYQNLKNFSQSKNSFLYMITLIKNDPLFESIREEPEFLHIIADMEQKYQKVHEDVGKWIADQKDF